MSAVGGAEQPPGDVSEEVLIAAPPVEVRRALVDADRRRRRWGHLELAPVAGGRFAERWTGPVGEEVVTAGSVVDVAVNRRLRLAWADADWPAQTEVEISLSPAHGGTHVRVRHSGFERLPDGRRLAREHRAGWRLHLSDLGSAVEETNPTA